MHTEGKNVKEITTVVSRTYLLNCTKGFSKPHFKIKRRKLLMKKKHMRKERVLLTYDVIWIDPELNQFVWEHGIRNVARRINLSLERKKNDDDEEGHYNKMYALVKLTA